MTESTIRLGVFAVILIIMGIAETRWPRRMLTASKPRRWTSNLSISVLSTFAVYLLLPLAPTAFALLCHERGWGILNSLTLPAWLAVPLAVLILDMLIYWQHVMFHKVPVLWRVHRMHHADVDIDTTTGIRFHPIEIVASMGIKLIAILLLGPAPMAVLLFEVLLNGCALFNHANVRLPLVLDGWLRLLMVTPDMHRVHHSTDMREANMNFGFNFPCWDRLFGTYKAQPDKGHDMMKIGMNIFREPHYMRIRNMLLIPFK